MVYWGRNYPTFFDVFRRFGAVVDLRPLQGERLGEVSDVIQLRITQDI
jgi:hypothetical protein